MSVKGSPPGIGPGSTTKAPPMQGDEIENCLREFGYYDLVECDADAMEAIRQVITAAEARGYERGMTVAAEIAQAYGIGQNISFRGLPRACEEIAAEIRRSLKP